MRNLLVYMLIAVAGLALTGCPLQVGGPWEFSVSDTNAPDDPLGDFTGMWRFYSDGTMVIRNNHLVFLQGIYTDDGTTIDFQVDRSRSTSLNGHEVVEYYWLSGTLTYIQGIDGMGLDGMGQYGISYSGSDNPEDNYSVSGDCNIDGMWSSYNQSMRWMVWMSVIVIVLDPIVAMFPA